VYLIRLTQRANTISEEIDPT